MSQETRLPPGVKVHPLQTHPDHRGRFTEVFRESWSTGLEPSRWDVLRAEAGALRGVHVHARSDSYLVLLQGRATVGLCDLRAEAGGDRRATTITLSSEEMAALIVPRGVAHGLYFHEPSVLARAMTPGQEPEAGLGCAWDDPGLGIPWPERSVRLSSQDAALPPLGELQRALAALAPGSTP